MFKSKNPMRWNDEEKAEILSPIATEENEGESFDLDSKTSSGLYIDYDALKAPIIIQLLKNISLALEQNQSDVFSLAELSSLQKQSLYNLLGEGEVSFSLEGIKAKETNFIGLWLIQDIQGDYLEVADFPKVSYQYIQEHTKKDFSMPVSIPSECMNISGLFSEIHEKYKKRFESKNNYILNFSLFPMNEADAKFLSQTLGHIGLKIKSKGYSQAIVRPTSIADIYSLQYQNNKGKIILDTIEVGHMPDAILATESDFKYSAERLREILKVYH